MSDISKLRIGDVEYDIKDTTARTHILNQLNPHNVTKTQIGLGKVENLSSAEILNKTTAGNISAALGYVPANRDELEGITTALNNSTEAKAIAMHKIDSVENSSVPAIVTFINGIKISNATISYDSNSDTVVFS